MEDGIILNLIENFWNILRRPGFTPLVVFGWTFCIGNLCDVVPSFCCFKAKCKNVIAFFYGPRTQCWNFRSVFAITLASTARLLKKMVDKAVNGAAGNRTHDPVTKIRVYVRLQILTIAVIGFRWEVLLSCVYWKKPLHKFSIGLAHIVFAFRGRSIGSSCCLFSSNFLSCLFDGFLSPILGCFMCNIRCPVLSLKIINIGFALNCFQFRRVGFPLLLTFSVSCFVSIDDIVRCSAYCICCHNGSFLVRCSMIDLTHWTKNRMILYECAGTVCQVEWP